MSKDIAIHLRVMAESHPYMKAVVFPEGKDSKNRIAYTHYTYKQLNDQCDILAKGFLNAGVKKGTRTVLMAQPSLDFFASTFALFRIGAIPVMIDPGMGVKNIKQCLKEANPDAFVGVVKAHFARIVLGWQRGKIKILISTDKKTIFAKTDLDSIRKLGLKHPETQLPEISNDDKAAILFTSGSTGSPKGAEYSTQNFNAQINLLKKTYQIQPGEVDLCTFPLFALFAPALGMTAIIPDMNFTKPGAVDPEKIFEPIENFAVSNMFGSPALLKRVASYGCKHKFKTPTIKRIISAGAPVPYQTIAQLTEIITKDAAIHTPYGATEALPICSISSNEILEETASETITGSGVCVGKPVQGVSVKIIKITDDAIPSWNENLVVENGTIGEIVVSGSQVTQSYFNRENANKIGKIKDTNADQYLHRMGDLGYFDPKGRLWFCGRKAHRVITPEETLFTVPCESIFNSHNKVYRTALVGVNQKNKTPNSKTPVLCVQTEAELNPPQQEQVRKELLQLAAKKELTKNIKTIMFHDNFPVDIRHNSKIFREKLSVWAAKELQ